MHVRLEVFNLLGQRIATLVDGGRAAGSHTAEWDATDAAGQAVGAGVYLYRLSGDGASITRRMLLIDGQAGIASGVRGPTVREEPAETARMAGLEWPVGIALDPSAGKMYWSDDMLDDGDDKTIQRANLDGSGVETVVTITGVGWSGAIHGIALDPSAGKMYWTVDAEGGLDDSIQRANLDGSGVEDLVTGLDGPSGVALDLSAGKMYWTVSSGDDADDRIQRANLDGSGVEDFVTGLGEPFDIALDLSAGKMYWTDSFVTKIQRANLDGSGVEDLVTGLEDPSGIALGPDMP